MSSYQDRPIVAGKEQRYRWELRRVDTVKRCYTFVHDLRTYSEACLYADVAVRQLGGDFIVWDGVELRPIYDSRLMREKFEDRPTTPDVEEAPVTLPEPPPPCPE